MYHLGILCGIMMYYCSGLQDFDYFADVNN